MKRRPDPRIYGAFERLVPIRVLGEVFEVPEGVPLIRALQYIEFELGRLRMDWSRFCFNDTIGCCLCAVAAPGGGGAAARACVVTVSAGLEVKTLPEGGVLLPPAIESAS
ncbi:MAG: (2Fe-2S)-binding protein [Myxococcales bacterium]|nr:(2Fe-2S)-binding protein [Myxococcales bacterium]